MQFRMKLTANCWRPNREATFIWRKESPFLMPPLRRISRVYPSFHQEKHYSQFPVKEKNNKKTLNSHLESWSVFPVPDMIHTSQFPVQITTLSSPFTVPSNKNGPVPLSDRNVSSRPLSDTATVAAMMSRPVPSSDLGAGGGCLTWNVGQWRHARGIGGLLREKKMK